MRHAISLALLVTLTAPALAQASMSRFGAACAGSIVRHGTVTSADDVKAACRCAERALDQNGIGESVRTAKGMYIIADGLELFEFYAPRYLWRGNGQYDHLDYPWMLSEADKGTRRDDHRRGADAAESCLSPKHIPESFFRLGASVKRQPGPAKTQSGDGMAGHTVTAAGQIVTASPAAFEGLKSIRFDRRRFSLEYPSAAMRANEEGTVVVAVKLNTDGTVARVAVASNASGHERLARAALDATLKTRFYPDQTTDGEFDGKFDIVFRIPDRAPTQSAAPGNSSPPSQGGLIKPPSH